MRQKNKVLEEARLRGDKVYDVGVPCGRGHVGGRYVSSGSCVECLANKRRHLMATNETYRHRAAATGKAFRQRNPTHAKEYRKNNSASIKIYLHNNAARIRRNKMESDRKNLVTYMLSTSKGNANKRGLEYNIDASDIIIPINCPVLGLKLTPRGTRATQSSSPSLDRIDSSRGYVKGNVQVVSFRANMLKNNATLAESIALAGHAERTAAAHVTVYPPTPYGGPAAPIPPSSDSSLLDTASL